MSEYIWNPENLKTLIDNSGYTIGSISKTVGLREATLSQYLRGNDPPTPSLRLLVALADFFAVPTDFLLGRCGREEAESLLKDYKYAYNALRREEYEDMYLKRKIFDDIPDGFYAPYPYNLLDDIFKPFDHLVTEDEMNGLNTLLSQFSPRTQHILDMRYQQEMTLEQIGNYYHLTRDRIRQIQAKAIRMLRHPSRKNRILYGETGFKKRRELEEWGLALNQKEEELARLAEQLDQARKELGREFEAVEIPEVESEYDKPKNERVMSWGTYYDPSDAFEDLNLSVRSWNCLRRANVNCVSDILDHLEKGDLLQIRNLGIASMNEIMAKIAEQRNGHFDPIPGLTYGYRLVLNAA